MAFKHQLSLEIPDTNNCLVLRLFDTSIYAENLSVTCETLAITPPGFNEPVFISVDSEFNLTLNSCDLKLQTVNCGSVSQCLPDGIYTISYSVSPNDKVFVEYKYLRVCQILNVYFNELCKLEMAACEPQADVKAKLEELRLIKSFIDAAKAKVEYCQDLQKGNDLLTYAKKRLDKYSSGHCS